jgi:hypothetical protein
MLLAVRLFRSLKRNHPKYYKFIGEPKVFGYTDSLDGYFQRLKGGVFIYSMVFKGVPGNFPKDMQLRKFTKVVRFVFTAVVTLFVALVIFTYFYYRSGQ